MNPFATIVYDKAEGIGWVTLNRPQVLNALNLQMRDELWEALHAAGDDPDVAVVVFVGAGASFSSGADVSEFGTAPSYVAARLARQERDLWGFLAAFPKPLVAAIHGYALGAGIELALFCDLRLCAEDARLGLPEVALAYISSAGGTQLLPRTVRPGLALGLILSGDQIDAQEAYRIGLVHRVVPRDRLYAEAEALASALGGLPQPAVRLAKEAVLRGLNMPLAQGLALEGRLAVVLLAAREAGL